MHQDEKRKNLHDFDKNMQENLESYQKEKENFHLTLYFAFENVARIQFRSLHLNRK